ncbi:MAG: helix-turn-helix domain-containing protein [Spirochaetales bacterium]|jgi:cytoskeletal protein RodZ|nr:helix-turn-helix domain-containing protein [Spirochaetales bacterium]
MESLGQKFKTSREALGFTVDQVARDTHISKRFIVSLEDENFDQFPGDTYIIGFIRNYADYLGLDQGELVNLYKNFKIQEQPIPIEELLYKKSRKPLIFTLLGIVVLAGLAGGAYVFFLNNPFAATRPERTEKPAAVSAAPLQYTLEDEALEQSFGQGDEILVKRQEADYTLRVEKIENTVLLLAPVENLSLQEGEEAYIQLTPQGETLKVICRSIQRGEQPKAVLFFDKYLQVPTEASAASDVAAAPPQAVGSTNEPSRLKRPQVIMESPSQSSFAIEIEFRGYCLFRYMADGQTREERYFRRGETFRTDVRREIRLWYSNAGSLRARIAGNEIEFGKPGEVGASVLRWVQAAAAPGARRAGAGYRLELVPMY